MYLLFTIGVDCTVCNNWNLENAILNIATNGAIKKLSRIVSALEVTNTRTPGKIPATWVIEAQPAAIISRTSVLADVIPGIVAVCVPIDLRIVMNLILSTV